METIDNIPNLESAPFDDEQIKKINDFQSNGKYHPMSCCEGNSPYCERKILGHGGILIAERSCLRCPCGEYTQNWVAKKMLE